MVKDTLFQSSRQQIIDYVEKKLILKHNKAVSNIINNSPTQIKNFKTFSNNAQTPRQISNRDSYRHIIAGIDTHKAALCEGGSSQVQVAQRASLVNKKNMLLQQSIESRQQQDKKQFNQQKIRINHKSGVDTARNTYEPSPETQKLYQDFKLKMRQLTEQKQKDEEDHYGGHSTDLLNIANIHSVSNLGVSKAFDTGVQERVELKRFLRYEKEDIMNINQIVTKESISRSAEEKTFMILYLKYKVPFFKSFQREVVTMICDKLQYKECLKGEIIMKKGDEGDCMYVLVKGEVGVYIDQQLTNCIAVLKENKVFGERALETDDKRGATIIAHEAVICLILHKKDFLSIVYHVKMIQKSQRQSFLQSIPFFKSWSYIKLMELNNLLNEQKYSTNDIIYDIGQKSEVFYILKAGRLALETIVTIEDQNTYPVGKSQWEISATKKQVLYKVKEIKPGEFFGHEEMLEELDKMGTLSETISPVLRQCRVRAIIQSDLIYLNKKDFYEFFNESGISKMKAEVHMLNQDEIVKRIRKNQFTLNSVNQAILNATRVNNIAGSVPQSQRNYLSSRERKIQKLQPWLEKIQNKQTVSSQILKESDRVKVLNVTKNKVIVDGNRGYISQSQNQYQQLSNRDNFAGGDSLLNLECMDQDNELTNFKIRMPLIKQGKQLKD